MAHIKSFRSAPHSIVQAVLAEHLRSVAAIQGADQPTGIPTVEDGTHDVAVALATVPHPRLGLPHGTVASSPIGVKSTLSSECIALMVHYAWAAMLGNKAKMAKIADEFEKSGCDLIGWLGAAFDYLVKRLEFWEPIAYRPPSSPDDTSYCYTLPEQDSFRVGILGDWGTGEEVAQDVINAMLRQNVDFIIHVGDVYYAGTGDEVQSNYLAMVANARASAVPGQTMNVPIYNMPGNHDYYFKGRPFYDALATVNAGTAFPTSPDAAVPIQGGSFFSLSNSWVQFQAMDTGYYDSDLFAVSNDTTQLHEVEAQWHLNRLTDAENDKRSVILFSHHQPWSRFLGIGNGPGTAGGISLGDLPLISFNPNLQVQLSEAPQGVVLAWFWGHEHVLEVYDQTAISASRVSIPTISGQTVTTPLSHLFPWVPYGACVGHSAFPVLDTDEPYRAAAPLIQYNETYTLDTTTAFGATVYNHGFTILDVIKNPGGKATAYATYYSLPADGGADATPIGQRSTIS